MTRLALVTDPAQVQNTYDEIFLWDGSAADSFKSQLGPALNQLGPVPALNGDFVRIALAIYASDHSVKRKARGSNWNARQLDITIPVTDPHRWSRVSGQLKVLADFLTGDYWTFTFNQLNDLAANGSLLPETSKRVVLFSGGADSGIGAVISASSLSDGETHALVSHASSGAARTAQKNLYAELQRLFSSKQAAHHRIFLSRGQKRLDGTAFPSEMSRRSRSLLFLALGLAVAAQSAVELWIPENGFASLNPPLGPERLGALSTRTTQPWFIWQVGELLRSVGAHGSIVNPFQMMTKGEMFAEVAKILGESDASTYLSLTNSCSHTDQNYQGGVSSGTHCGVCFGCIVRRSSFKAAALTDETRYLSDEPDYAAYVASHSVEAAVRDFVSAGISQGTVIMMPLPPSLSARQAMDLCLRGQEELRAYIG
jgi:hypothetical protein